MILREASAHTWRTLGVATAIALLSGWRPALAQTGRPIRVMVADSSGTPLQDALVSWMPSGVRGRSGPDGIARFQSVLFGPEVLTVRRLGYERISAPMMIDTLEPEEVTVILRASPSVLHGVTVHDTVGVTWLADFDQRRRRGKGRFVTADQISRAHGGSFGALLQRSVPGILVSGPNDLEQRVYSMRGPNSFGAADCQVAVYIDGVREPGGNAGSLPLQLIGGVEYYPPGEVPVQYKDPTEVRSRGGARGGSAACGVMLLWTR